MSVPQRDQAYLWDMLERARAAVHASRSMVESDLTRLSPQSAALERWIEIVGEAARKISPAFKAEHPAVPWSKIVATRHVLAHDYGLLKYDTIWRITTVYLPELIRVLEPLMLPPPPDPEP